MEEPLVRKFTWQILKAVDYIHNIPNGGIVIHKDIKGEVGFLTPTCGLQSFGLCPFPPSCLSHTYLPSNQVWIPSIQTLERVDCRRQCCPLTVSAWKSKDFLQGSCLKNSHFFCYEVNVNYSLTFLFWPPVKNYVFKTLTPTVQQFKVPCFGL